MDASSTNDLIGISDDAWRLSLRPEQQVRDTLYPELQVTSTAWLLSKSFVERATSAHQTDSNRILRKIGPIVSPCTSTEKTTMM